MDLQRVGVLAPCEGVADFPTYHVGDDATALWAAWTAAWRPSLLHATGRLPEVVSAYDPPAANAWRNGLLLVPGPGSDEALEWLDEVRAEQSPHDWVIDGFTDRDGLTERITAAAGEVAPTEAALELDFYALGYAYLQVGLLTHELQYGSVFDPALFQSTVCEAAGAAVMGEPEAAHAGLARAYDQLHEARNHAYPVGIHLLEVLLVAETTLGETLAKALSSAAGATVLLTGDLADRIATDYSETASALRQAVGEGRACVANGGRGDEDLSLLPPQVMLNRLREAHAAIEQLAGAPPKVYASRRGALPPRLPQALAAMGYAGAMLVGFDGTPPPSAEHGRTTWVGLDGTALEAAIAYPRDLAKPETLFGLHDPMAESLGRDQTATLVLAGWPGAASPLLADLLRVTAASEVLGQVTPLDEFLQTSSAPDHWGHIEYDTLGPTDVAPDIQRPTELAESQAKVADALTDLAVGPGDDDSTAVDRLARRLGGEPSAPAADTLVLNPLSFPLGSGHAPEAAPPLGFLVAPAGVQPKRGSRAEDTTLRNERLEVTIDPSSGGVRSIRPHAVRNNLASQRVVLLGAGGRSAVAEMHADHVEVVEDSASAGAILSRGSLLTMHGQRLAGFEQHARLAAGCDWLEVTVTVTPEDATPENRRLAALRIATRGDAQQLHRGLQWVRATVNRATFVTDGYVAVDTPAGPVGVAVDRPRRFRRLPGRVLESPLAALAHGRMACRFALFCGEARPLHAALALAAGVQTAAVTRVATTPERGWMLHCDAANVVVSHLKATPEGGGLSVGLIETEGRAAELTLRCCRSLKRAVRESLSGEVVEAVSVEEGAARLEIGPYGWLRVAASW
ncbi:MAG: hypothetical protein AAGJ46_15600 [Planctomycetota bacterium]